MSVVESATSKLHFVRVKAHGRDRRCSVGMKEICMRLKVREKCPIDIEDLDRMMARSTEVCASVSGVGNQSSRGWHLRSEHRGMLVHG